jgi:uncharacterized protein
MRSCTNLITSLCLVILMAGCSSAPVTFYTLTPAEPITAAASQAQPSGKVILVIRPAPAEIDSTRILVRTGQNSMRVTELAEWTSPFADEVRAALTDALRRRFGMLVLSEARPNEGQLSRVDLTLHKFEAVEGVMVSLVADWSVTAPGNPQSGPLRCQSVLSAKPTAGIDGVVAASQSAILQLADQIGAAVQAGATAGSCK